MTKYVLRALAGAAVGLLLLACGGGDDDDGGSATESGGDGANGKTFFAVDKADEAAHAAMPKEGDLPGGGWELTAEDEADEEDSEFAELAKKEPACAQIAGLVALGNLGGVFGKSEAAKPAGRAQIEHQKEGSGQIPTSVEVEVEIEKTVADVQGGWKIAKELLEAKSTSNCIARVLNKMFQDQFADSGIQLTLDVRTPARKAPHDGAAMSFAMVMKLQNVLSLDVVMEMYFWPYANSQTTMLVFGPKSDVTASFLGDLLTAVDKKLVEAEKKY